MEANIDQEARLKTKGSPFFRVHLVEEEALQKAQPSNSLHVQQTLDDLEEDDFDLGRR